LQDMTIEFWLIEIITDVGISVNSIADSIKMLRVVNAEFPLARRFTDDQLSEKLLSMVEHGSRMFALEAKKELDAVEGVPGTPGVRQFQLAAPAERAASSSCCQRALALSGCPMTARLSPDMDGPSITSKDALPWSSAHTTPPMALQVWAFIGCAGTAAARAIAFLLYHGACVCTVRQIVPYTEVLVSLVRLSQ